MATSALGLILYFNILNLLVMVGRRRPAAMLADLCRELRMWHRRIYRTIQLT